MTLRLRSVDGRQLDVPLTPRHPLVVGVELTGDVTTDVRRMVRADVIRRAADRHRAVARVVALSSPTDELRELLDGVNCRPLTVDAARPDITVGRADARVVSCLPADDGAPVPALPAMELRHLLLGATAGGSAVGDWQRLVAIWAESPSKPMCAEYLERCDAVVDDDVDTAAVLAVMGEIERDADLPAGSKFEMFAHLDAIVGLDLTSQVGHPLP